MRWIAALAIGLLWVGALIALVAVTSNPVTLNRLQIAESQFVVTARVLDVSAGTVEVSHEWRQGAGPADAEIVLDNLKQTEARNGREFLIPVSREPGGRLVVTATRLPNARPLVYPSTPEARTALTELMDQLQRRSEPSPALQSGSAKP